MRSPLGTGDRLVVKVGSSSLLGDAGTVDDGAIARIVGEVAESWRSGIPTVLVTSGAVAAGLSALGVTSPPTDLPGMQVAAAVGQGRLMHRYSRSFEDVGMVAGQVLITLQVLASRDQYLHARRLLDRMLDGGVVPVVNENDSVVVDELRMGDNDRLAAIVSHLVRASLLVILTDTDGIFAADPRLGKTEFLAAVDHSDRRLDGLVGAGPLGSGGVGSKVAAARMAAYSRIPTVVAAADSSLAAITAGQAVGTWVAPRPVALPARKLWIAFCQPVSGGVTVDVGAETALLQEGRSLLPVGVVDVTGNFGAGDTVDVHGPERLVGRGLSRLSAADLRTRKGHRGGDEAIHRDDLVVFG